MEQPYVKVKSAPRAGNSRKIAWHTCSREPKAASRYFCAFFVHAEDIRLNIALGASGLDAEIASWHEEQRADNAFNITSFPCHVQSIQRLSYIYEVLSTDN